MASNNEHKASDDTLSSSDLAFRTKSYQINSPSSPSRDSHSLSDQLSHHSDQSTKTSNFLNPVLELANELSLPLCDSCDSSLPSSSTISTQSPRRDPRPLAPRSPADQPSSSSKAEDLEVLPTLLSVVNDKHENTCPRIPTPNLHRPFRPPPLNTVEIPSPEYNHFVHQKRCENCCKSFYGIQCASHVSVSGAGETPRCSDSSIEEESSPRLPSGVTLQEFNVKPQAQNQEDPNGLSISKSLLTAASPSVIIQQFGYSDHPPSCAIIVNNPHSGSHVDRCTTHSSPLCPNHAGHPPIIIQGTSNFEGDQKVRTLLYKVHRHFFDRYSTFFHDLFCTINLDARDIDDPIFLAEIEPHDFDCLLSVFYPRSFDSLDRSTAEWVSILSLSTRWSFADIRQSAVNHLAPRGVTTAIDKIVLGTKYDVREWLAPAYEEVCLRERALDVEEGARLGSERVVKIFKLRVEFGLETGLGMGTGSEGEPCVDGEAQSRVPNDAPARIRQAFCLDLI
ncbi:hypothetical protein CVT24_004268 [Panaeolus cyanescens]|uniref:BTB domain-containing protein n=1 Tax=Panaeolus cyanescens TaxID=181874 RepID=A0A409VCI3_9AGAR|nr:hypothetical protein CVT24_004268 [Panaeolus cyanescens]